MKSPFITLKLIDSKADELERLACYDIERRIAKEIRELCKDFILNDKTLKIYIEKAMELKKEHGKITPSLLARHLKLDNYAASYVVDMMKDKKML